MSGDVVAAAVSTGTDFWPDARVTVDDVKALRDALDAKIAVKATGNLRDPQIARDLLAAGATRLGTTQPALLLKS
jgi:deoxyribose-phosphate aldolase